MLGVAMLASFLVCHLNRALPALSRSRAITCDLLLLATANLDGHRYRRRPWLAATGRSPSPGRPAARAWTCRTAVVAADGSKL
jgi:hypothetical protein